MTTNHIAVPALVFNGVEIHDRNEMLSLTDMWKAGGSDPQHAPAKWRALPSAKAFIDHVEVTIGKSDSELFVVKNGGRQPGTYAHWQIGLAYAKYLSPEFHMWCNTVVRERMEGKPAPAAPQAPYGVQVNCIREGRLSYQHHMRICRSLGITGMPAHLAAGRAVKALLGIDILSAMAITHAEAPGEEPNMTPSTIGRQIGLSGRDVNAALCRLGYQTSFRDAKDRLVYEPTQKGRDAGGRMFDTGKKHGSGAPVTQLMWSSKTLSVLKADLDMERA